MKNLGLLIYVIAFFLVGILSIISTVFAFHNKLTDFAYPTLFIIILILLGRIIKRYQKIME